MMLLLFSSIKTTGAYSFLKSLWQCQFHSCSFTHCPIKGCLWRLWLFHPLPGVRLTLAGNLRGPITLTFFMAEKPATCAQCQGLTLEQAASTMAPISSKRPESKPQGNEPLISAGVQGTPAHFSKRSLLGKPSEHICISMCLSLWCCVNIQHPNYSSLCWGKMKGL